MARKGGGGVVSSSLSSSSSKVLEGFRGVVGVLTVRDVAPEVPP